MITKLLNFFGWTYADPWDEYYVEPPYLMLFKKWRRKIAAKFIRYSAKSIVFDEDWRDTEEKDEHGKIIQIKVERITEWRTIFGESFKGCVDETPCWNVKRLKPKPLTWHWGLDNSDSDSFKILKSSLIEIPDQKNSTGEPIEWRII